MTEDQDNAGEVVAATVRVALTAAGQLAEQSARRNEFALRDSERESSAQTATMQAQLAAERRLALGSVQDVLRRGERASVEEIAQVWQQVRAWNDPATAIDRDRLSDLVRDRFGVDPGSLDGARAANGKPEIAPHQDNPAAAALLKNDAAGQLEAVNHQGTTARARAVASDSHLEHVGVDAAAVQALAVAAQSHPTAPTLAAQRPAVGSQARRRHGKRRAGVEVQSFGR